MAGVRTTCHPKVNPRLVPREPPARRLAPCDPAQGAPSEVEGRLGACGLWHMQIDSSPAASGALRIAFCQPELAPLRQAARGESTEAAHIQQGCIAAALQARGHRLTCLAPHGLSEVECATDLDRPMTVPRTWSASGWFDLAGRAAWRAQRVLGVPYLNVFSNYRRLDACLRCLPGHDVVHERNGLYNAGVAMACRRLGLPYVVFFDADQLAEHDFMGTPITGLLRWRAGQLLRYNLRTARRVVCVSEPARARLVETWRVPADRIVVLPNGVDVARFRPSAGARQQVRASTGLGDRPVVIFVGNFHAWHDVATLLDAFAAASASLPAARLLLVGQGPTHEAMVGRAGRLGVSNSVRFLGPVAHREIPGLLAAADVAVAPVPVMNQGSWLSPMKVFEYMAAGLAVVATRSGQLGEVLTDGRNARLVGPGDSPAMAAALVALLGDRGLRARLGAQARQDAVDRHSWDRYASCLEQVYAAAIAAGAPARRA